MSPQGGVRAVAQAVIQCVGGLKVGAVGPGVVYATSGIEFHKALRLDREVVGRYVRPADALAFVVGALLCGAQWWRTTGQNQQKGAFVGFVGSLAGCFQILAGSGRAPVMAFGATKWTPACAKIHVSMRS